MPSPLDPFSLPCHIPWGPGQFAICFSSPQSRTGLRASFAQPREGGKKKSGPRTLSSSPLQQISGNEQPLAPHRIPMGWFVVVRSSHAAACPPRLRSDTYVVCAAATSAAPVAVLTGCPLCRGGVGVLPLARHGSDGTEHLGGHVLREGIHCTGQVCKKDHCVR